MSSALRIIVIGFNSQPFDVANALMGRVLFESISGVPQHHIVELDKHRTLNCSVPARDLTWGRDCLNLWEELYTAYDINSIDAVVLSVQFLKSLELLARGHILKCAPWKEVIRRKGVIIVTEADTFTYAQRSGRISVSFMDWMRQQKGEGGALFQEVQERCLLINTDGNRLFLARQRNDLVDMIDNDIKGCGVYTNNFTFRKNEQKFAKMEKHFSGLKKKFWLLLLGLLVLLLFQIPNDRKASTAQGENKELNQGVDVVELKKMSSRIHAMEKQMADTAVLGKTRELRRYTDDEFKKMTSRFLSMEKQLATIKDLDQQRKEKVLEKNKTDLEVLDKVNQSAVELFTELKKQLLNETSAQIESMKKNIPRSSIVWGMIHSLSMSLPLIFSWTLLILLVVPIKVPIPWGNVLAALLVSLLILQLILILILLGL